MQAEAKHPVWVFTEIPWLAMFGHIALATLLGFLAGVALGLVSFWTMKKLKWFHFPPVTKTWVLVVFALWLVGCISLAGTVWGFFEGAYQGGQMALRESPVGKQWLPKAGEFAGELFFLFDQTLNQKERPGEKLEIKEFFSQLEKLKEDAAGKLADQIVEKALMQNPDWQGYQARGVVPLVFSPFGQTTGE